MSAVDSAARGLSQRVNRFVIADPEKCIGCYNCEAGCVDVHEKAGLAAYPRLQVTHTVLGTMPLQCRNCDDAPCEKVCPVQDQPAVYVTSVGETRSKTNVILLENTNYNQKS